MYRRVRALAAVIVFAVVGFAAATVLGAASEPPKQASNPEQQSGISGSDSVESIQADPAQQGPSWGVVVFTAKNKEKCAAAGRSAAGKVGSLRGDGSIDPYPIEDGASCIDLDAVPAGAQVTMGTGPDARTVIHGIAGPDVKSVTLKTPTQTRNLAIGPRGSFLAVLESSTTPNDVAITVRLRSGEVRGIIG